MNVHTKPAPATTYDPIDAIDAGLDIVRTVRLALMSKWYDPAEIPSIATMLTTAIRALEPLRVALDNGSESTFEAGMPRDKILIDRRIPKVMI